MRSTRYFRPGKIRDMTGDSLQALIELILREDTSLEMLNG